jgi:hypothetical protein
MIDYKRWRRSKATRKLSVDWAEKFSIGAALIGLFQAQTPLIATASMILAGVSGYYSFWLAEKLEREGE